MTKVASEVGIEGNGELSDINVKTADFVDDVENNDEPDENEPGK